MDVQRCKLCGGSVGCLNERREHNLCRALADLGLPTPSLGDRCPECKGAGTIGEGGVMLDFALGPATIRKSIDAQFPPCLKCGGSGKV